MNVNWLQKNAHKKKIIILRYNGNKVLFGKIEEELKSIFEN